MAAVLARHPGALLPDDPGLFGVVRDVAEPGAGAGRLVHREEQPPLDAHLHEPALAVADLLLGQLPVAHLQIALGHVVHPVGRLDVRRDERRGNGPVDVLEAIARRSDACPLRDLRPIDLSELQLIRLHRETWPRAEPPEESLSARDAVVRHSHEQELGVLPLARLDELPEQGRRQTLAPVRGMDLDLAPEDVRVLRLVQAAPPAHEADDVAVRGARADARVPLVRGLRSQAGEDRLERARRLLGEELGAHELEQPRDGLQLGVGKRVRIDVIDRVRRVVHPGSLPGEPAGTINRDTFALASPPRHRRGRWERRSSPAGPS